VGLGFFLYVFAEGILFAFFLYWSFIIANGAYYHLKCKGRSAKMPVFEYPMISIIMPVKNEEKTLPFSIDSIIKNDYPKDKMEIIIVEDGSVDRTYDIAKNYEELYPGLIKVYKLESNDKGKAGALNFGAKMATSRILVFVDADTRIGRDYLKKAVAKFLTDKRVLVGLTAVRNRKRNWLSFMVSLESDLINYIIRGSEKLGLPSPIVGYSLVIDKEILEKVGGFRKSLTEDIDLWARLVMSKVKVGSFEGVVYIEPPATITDFFKQRLRWYKGYIDTLDLYFKVPRDKKTFHMIMYLAMPLFGALSTLLSIGFSLLKSLYLLYSIAGFTLNYVGVFIIVLIYLKYFYKEKIDSLKVKYSMFSYLYFILMSLSTIAALFSKVLGIEIKWHRKPR
jgi:cellulose synthase/poly-beta-1,6-N-acetylglucosamine synthase-like glycosyltransferase